ncbi:TRAP transporter substrate-binding protein [Paracoccus sp. SCSIO 75233]|uniref:TRAP transporter substrate-binding protein n=1 Tax=Paracoccus sp. SCSIO 75233 TaxID=3017782 RepID=UPI0022EFE799|nr:TRAP transporter substrate-binding protein [Paracoccus sp. SCSIO 75233]WBU53288.1 TRAP transporter substrate-binding protein [Paracoccus sp. SCSIO 75233]
MTKHFALAAAALAATTALASAADVKMGYALSENSHYGAGAKAFDETLKAELGDAFTVQHFPSSGLGGEREVIEGMQIGTIDATIASSGTLSNFVPEVGVFDIPFLLRDLEHARTVLDGEIGDEMLAKFDDVGLHALAWGEQGFRHITNSRGPIETPDDLEGLKIRTMENPVHIKAFEALGAAPTPMAWPEVIPALQQGAIDGQENPLSVIVSANLNEVQDFASLDGHVYSPAIVMLSGQLWDSLDDTQKAAFEKAGDAAVVAMRDYVDNVEVEGIEALKERGMQVNILSGEQKKLFQDALADVYVDYEAEFGKELMDNIIATE